MRIIQGLKIEFEIAVINKPSVFEPSKFHCIWDQIFLEISVVSDELRLEDNESCLYIVFFLSSLMRLSKSIIDLKI